MAATNDPHEAVFLALKKIRDDDSGAGGLANTTGSQYVHVDAYIRSWEHKANASPPIPRVVIEIVDDHDEAPFTKDCPKILVRMHLFTDLDGPLTVEQAILTRMRTVYFGTSMGAQGGFAFNRFRWIRTIRAPGNIDKKLRHRIVEGSIYLTV